MHKDHLPYIAFVVFATLNESRHMAYK